MIHQLRIYEFHTRDHAARIMQRYEFDIVAMWEAKKAEQTEFVYLLRWPDERPKIDAWTAFMADREWNEIKKAIRDRGSLGGRIEDRLLRPTDYSPPL